MAVGRARFSWKLSFVWLGILALVSLKSPLAQQDGAFLDELNVRLISKGKIELLNDFKYRDSKNDIWKAPKGYVSDGASIPQVFWSVVGGPLDGDYRDAAVIHDYFCDTKQQTWQATHRVFYDAMRARGVGETKAKTLYYAVYRFGPRWCQGCRIQRPIVPTYHDEEFQKMKREIEQGNVSLEQIDAASDAVVPPNDQSKWRGARLRRAL